jgi:WD40 repeat protein
MHRFILSSRNVIENTPLQAYSSALLFSPVHCLTRELFQDEEPDWITTKPAMEADWGACIQTLYGHSNSARSVAFSHDGTQVVSGSGDQTVKIWDASSGACLKTLEGHSNLVNSVAFSHDGTQVVSGSDDHTVKIWDASSGACLKTLEGHSNSVYNVAFDSNTALATTTLEEPRHSYGLNSDQAWITYNGQNVLWLPSEYRPSCSAVMPNTIVIGCPSGRVLTINFSFNKSPLK